MRRFPRIASSVAALFLFAAFNASAATSLPAVSSDGLHLVPDTKMRAVYMRPGADLSEYTELAILECYVAFAKDWQRNHNNDVVGLSGRISNKDMQNIREKLAKEFSAVFDEVLKKGGHKLVSKGGPGVLIVRPAIINLEVTAPDVMSAGMNRTYARSSGQMTLYMELLDGVTGDLIAKVIDPEAGNEGGFAEYLNSVTNKADADRILRRWAKTLSDHLGEVKAANGK